MAHKDFRMPEPRVYSHHDLFPGLWDPLCSVQFPLGNFWPVYVGNFWCLDYSQHATKVQEYFASKGLLVRMVFGPSALDYQHFQYQCNYHVYDFLVYFVRSEDADDAVTYCHREKYYGHRLNVFPGRVPLRFDLTRSVKHTIQQPLRLHMTEQVFETYIQSHCNAEMSCVVQHSKNNIIAEYVSEQDRDEAILHCRVCIPKLVESSQQKQRFIEQDVQNEILERMQNDPTFLNMLPPDIILAMFFHGIRYNCYRWRYENKLQMSKRLYLTGPYRARLHIIAFRNAYKYFGIICMCSTHTHMASKNQKRFEQRPVKAATEAQSIAPDGSAGKRRIAGENFYDDSYDIDPTLGTVF